MCQEYAEIFVQFKSCKLMSDTTPGMLVVSFPVHDMIDP